MKAITPTDPSLKTPHRGWNPPPQVKPHPLRDGTPPAPAGLRAYFVHSYPLSPADPGDVVATTDYGGPVTAILGRDNLVGAQFHPEKSQALGLKLIANFLRWRP